MTTEHSKVAQNGNGHHKAHGDDHHRAADEVEDKTAAPEYSSDEKDAPRALYDVRVAIVGNVDSGKSTLIGVLTNGGLDNGRGLARSRVFAHRHEAETGRTSCISQHIMGFDTNNQPVHQTVPASAAAAQKNKSWRDVVHKSRSTLTLIDLAGHEKYLRTTIAGLTGCFPDFAVVVVGANAGITKMTREHLGVVIALDIPLIVVITKVDMAPENVLDESKKQLHKILKSNFVRRKPFEVKNEQDVETCVNGIHARITPIFLVSAVTGTNLNLLTDFLARMKPQNHWIDDTKTDAVEFSIDETFVVTGVGLVLSGTVSKGVLRENSALLAGPFGDGSFRRVLVRTIHCKRTPAAECTAGNSCAVAVRAVSRKEILKRNDIRRGMVLVDPNAQPRAARKFEAEVLVLHHPTTIKSSYQAVIHCGSIRQSAAILRMSSDCLRTGDKAKVEFEFMMRPEYMHVGQTILFREGSTKGVGRITKIFQDDKLAPAPAAPEPAPADNAAAEVDPSVEAHATALSNVDVDAADADVAAAAAPAAVGGDERPRERRRGRRGARAAAKPSDDA